MSVPKINVPQSKLDKLADDLGKLEVQTVVQIGREGSTFVPAFQRQGYLEKLGHARQKWFKRFFVLRDSYMLSYNLQKSDFTVEPRAAIHLGNSSIQVVEQSGKSFCFMVTTIQQDRFLFAAETEEERTSWVRALESSRNVTHANMIKLAVENQCLAEEKGAAAVALQHSTSALSIFSNSEYIRNTPTTGGAEGWLRTLGFNPDDQKKSLFKMSGRKALDKCYFILRDSHLLMFHGGDILTKPRGAMYLLGTQVTIDDDDGASDEFRFSIKSSQCGDEIVLVASSHKVRTRWVQALKIGARVTYPDFQLLLKEHSLLSAVTMTPRAASPPKPNAPADKLSLAPPPLLADDVDLQGEQLDAGTQQAFDDHGVPLLRNPDGKLVSPTTGEVVAPTQPRFGSAGEQLDPFNRPLPPGAVPMFTIEGKPIGVGVDGQHYLIDGTVVDRSAPHYDHEGNILAPEIVDAANAVATNLNIAIKVRAKLRSDDAAPEPMDVLGRTFRALTDVKSTDATVAINADGDAVPLASARRYEAATGQLVTYTPEPAAPPPADNQLVIKVDEEGEERAIGRVEITSSTTLRQVRAMITAELETNLPDFVFLINGVPLLKYEENSKLAGTCMPEIVIRGKELKKVDASVGGKVTSMSHYEEQKKKETDEFMAVMNRVRQGNYLRSAKLGME